jgi:pyruvate decarboxylase
MLHHSLTYLCISAFSEHVPVVHIVGVPNTGQQKEKPLLHHTLGDGRYTIFFLKLYYQHSPFLRYDAYLKAARQFTWTQGVIFETTSAASEIDRVLTACITSVSFDVAEGRAWLAHRIMLGSACVP